MFLVLEGIEGCGKSTQAKMLAEWFEKQGHKVWLTKAPGGTELGKMVREFILHSTEKINDYAELLLYKADAAQHCDEIRRKIEEGCIVISDRYYYSTIAYQGFARGLDLKVINQLNEISTQGLEPDMLFIVDTESVEQCLERSKKSSGRYDRFESLSVDFHKKVQQGYNSLKYDYLYLIDGNGTIEETFDKIIRLVRIKTCR